MAREVTSVIHVLQEYWKIQDFKGQKTPFTNKEILPLSSSDLNIDKKQKAKNYKSQGSHHILKGIQYSKRCIIMDEHLLTMIDLFKTLIYIFWKIFQTFCRTIAWLFLIPVVMLSCYDFSLYTYRVARNGLGKNCFNGRVKGIPSGKHKLFHRGEL